MQTPGVSLESLSEQDRRTMSKVARERMKLKLLADIRADLMICEIEGWDRKEYLRDLQEMLNGFKV